MQDGEWTPLDLEKEDSAATSRTASR
jgi:hypothetical protein